MNNSKLKIEEILAQLIDGLEASGNNSSVYFKEMIQKLEGAHNLAEARERLLPLRCLETVSQYGGLDEEQEKLLEMLLSEINSTC
jgi:hypothetical protein